MCKQRFSISVGLLMSCLICLSAQFCPFGSRVTADEVLAPEARPDAPVSVLCYGRLRHGVVAIGGETTGTTITFHRVTWELRLPNEASRQFAEQHHKQLVVVTGHLRKEQGIETPDRSIVDVSRVAEPDSRELVEEGATMSIQGTLRAALSTTGQLPEFSVSTGDQQWRLDVTSDRKIQSAAESLIRQPVIVSGSLLPVPEGDSLTPVPRQSTSTATVRVKSIQPVAIRSVAPRPAD
ncbi:MAG: hypothetical protein R3C59_13300 [Planctomycetaceae bacterium]